jgi:hypothetical protein
LEAEKIIDLSGFHFCYRVYGLTIISDIQFPELIASPRSATASAVRVQFRSETHVPEPVQWFDRLPLPNGEQWLSHAKIDGGYLLRFHNFADFFVDRTGRKIVLARRNIGSSISTSRHLLLNQVLPMVLSLLGRDAIHATAVVSPYGACAFVGPSGSGKSTLAASFLVAGYPVMADDCLVLEKRRRRIFATPAYPGLRLRNDAVQVFARDGDRPIPVAEYTAKARLLSPCALRNFPKLPQPLAGIYRVVRNSKNDARRTCPRVETFSARETFMQLVSSTMLLDTGDTPLLRRQFRFFENVLARVPVRKLVLPDDFSALPDACETVLADLGAERSKRSGLQRRRGATE